MNAWLSSLLSHSVLLCLQILFGDTVNLVASRDFGLAVTQRMEPEPFIGLDDPHCNCCWLEITAVDHLSGS